jgi:hypothetical protein
MFLYIDDDSVDRALIRRLMGAGHGTLDPVWRGLPVTDAAHLIYAIRTQRVLVTRS